MNVNSNAFHTFFFFVFFLFLFLFLFFFFVFFCLPYISFSASSENLVLHQGSNPFRLYAKTDGKD